ncbi:LysR family transcriptional regulator [Raoultibacter massiliensis]|uniref:LysR family transcriptional regulator n=1 Tax=Raoultibacter massiliensis TaxID=1852371 RepID=UPI003A9347AA
MELYQLKYFVQVAKLESISKAAALLHISQPALSKTIIKLEDELGTQLFDRIGKRIYLNDRGRFFLESVEKTLRDLTGAVSVVGGTAGDLGGTISVGVFGPQSEAIACTTEFMRANPQYDIVFDARQKSSTSQVVREFDMVFFPATAAFENIAGMPYARNKTALCVFADHPLAGLERAELHLFKDEPFIFMNTTAGIYEQSYQLCIECGFSPRIRAVTSSGVAQMRLIEAGLGVGFVDVPVRSSGNVRVSYLDLGMSLADQVLCFACRPVHLLSPAAKRLLSFTMQYFGLPENEQTLACFEKN